MTLRPPSKAFAVLQCGELHTGQEPCSAAFLYMRIRYNAPSCYSSEADYQRKSKDISPWNCPFSYVAHELGKCCLPPFYTGDTQLSLRYSKDAPTEVESNPRLALSELKCPLPVASVHMGITHPWVLSWVTKHQFSRAKIKTH